MSAPTALESGALRRGIAKWAGKTSPRRRGAAPQRERRSTDPVAALSRRYDDLCRQACDPYEIAAVLEAEGLDDRRARAEFGAASVFELGERLYGAVPWRPEDPQDRRDPWHLPLWRAQLRGVLYAVPAVTAALLPAATDGVAGRVLPALGTVVAIAAAQAVSVLGHLLLGRGRLDAFAGLTRAALAVAALLALASSGIAALVGGPQPAGLVATLGLQLVLVVAATLLLVPGREALLAAVMLPGALAAAGVVLGLAQVPARLGGPVALQEIAVASVVGAALAALLAARPGRRGGTFAALRAGLGRAQWGLAGTAALYGVGLAVAVSFALVAAAAGTVEVDGVHLVLVALPLTATVGTSEYLLHRARGRSARALAGLDCLDGFARRSRRELRWMLALHAVTVTVAAVAVVGWLDRTGQRRPELDALAGGYAVLGLALLLTATLLSLGHHRLAARLVLVAGAVLVVAALLPLPSAIGAVVATAGFLVLAYRVAATCFAAVTAHR